MTTTNRQYIAYETPADYWVNDFFGDEYQRDITSYTSLKNTFAIALREGFNKWAKAGLTAFVNYEMRTYNMVDTLGTASNAMTANTQTTSSASAANC